MKGRAKDIDDNVIGSYGNNPILNSLVYYVEFEDGVVKQYATNTIASNMYAQVDSEEFSQSLLASIIDYRSDGLHDGPSCMALPHKDTLNNCSTSLHF